MEREAIIMGSATYQAGDEIDIDGVTIALGRRKGSTGIRWTWFVPGDDIAGAQYLPTPEEAIEDARRKLAPENRCACGAPAEMTLSTRRVCTNCA